LISTLSVGAGVLLGCSHEQSQADAVAGTRPSTGVTSQQNGADQAVADRIATARCSHERTCNNVGPGRTYASAAACKDEISASTFNDLNAYNCPHGIDQKQLESCVQSLATRDCGLSLKTLTESDQCKASGMCMK